MASRESEIGVGGQCRRGRRTEATEGAPAPQLVADHVRGDGDHERLERLGLAQRVHAPEERQKDLLNEVVDVVLGPERSL